MNKTIVFSGATIITPAHQLKKDLVVENGIIKEIREQCEVKNGEELEASIKAVKQAAINSNSNILGYHIEGIYLDHEFREGHLDEYLHKPDPKEYEPLIEKYGDFVTEWTLAPELPGAIELIKACKKAGIITSVGHSQATYEQMMQAIENGLSHSTHFACVMGTLRFTALRESAGKGFAPGVMETILLDDRLTTEIIADGFHLHKESDWH